MMPREENFLSEKKFLERVYEAGAFQSKEQVQNFFEAFCHCLSQALMKGEAFNIPLVGAFTINDRPHKYARNPRTGEKYYVPAGKILKFTPAKALKEHYRNLNIRQSGPATKKFPEKKSPEKKSPE